MALTISPPAELSVSPAEFSGSQYPRIRSVPVSVSSSGSDAIDLAARAGLVLDPWERLVLEDALGETADGLWSAFEVGLVVPRQNGKGAVLEARELAGLFLFGERLILHTAHEAKTSTEAFLRIQARVTNYDEFRRRVKRVNRSHGEEGIELLSGQRLRFIARSRVAGVGFTGDAVILDEAFELPESVMSALLPTMSARPNPQIWYTSSAARKQKHPNCRVLASVRRSGIKHESPKLAYLEWSIDGDGLDPLQRKALRTDERALAEANPGLDARLNRTVIDAERRRMEPEDFDAHRLGIGDYPVDEEEKWEVIAEDDWKSLIEPASSVSDTVAFAVDVSPDRRTAAIAVAGRRSDDRVHVEVVDHLAGVNWVVPRLLDLRWRWRPCAIVVDPGSEAGSLTEDIEKAGIELVPQFTARDAARACGQFRGLVANQGLRHLDQPSLNAALAGAQLRPLSDAHAWDRKGGTDICPLVAASLAVWAFGKYGRPRLAPYDISRSVA